MLANHDDIGDFIDGLRFSRARPTVGHLDDLAGFGRAVDYFAEGFAFFVLEVFQAFAHQGGMRGKIAVRATPIRIEVSVFEATFALGEHLQGLGLIRVEGGHDFFQHGLGFVRGPVIAGGKSPRGEQQDR